jgi:hypothetical protein
MLTGQQIAVRRPYNSFSILLAVSCEQRPPDVAPCCIINVKHTTAQAAEQCNRRMPGEQPWKQATHTHHTLCKSACTTAHVGTTGTRWHTVSPCTPPDTPRHNVQHSLLHHPAPCSGHTFSSHHTQFNLVQSRPRNVQVCPLQRHGRTMHHTVQFKQMVTSRVAHQSL